MTVRLIWVLFFSEEYWGDAYHNLWMVIEYENFGDYIDYKDRHVVWLPAYRWLLILFSTFTATAMLPLLLQAGYILTIVIWARAYTGGSRVYGIFILSYWPLAVVFSGFSMPENLSLFVITALLYVLLQSRISRRELILIGVLSAVSSLTRHEATAYLGVLCMLLWIHGKRRESVSVFAGVVSGLMVFSVWNYYSIGNAFFWFSSKFTASSAGARAVIDSNGMIDRVSESLLAILFVFPFAPLLLWKWNDLKRFWRSHPNEKLVHLSALVFLILFFLASLFFFHGADPKYLLLASFPCALITFRLSEHSKTTIKQGFAFVLILLVPIYMLIFHLRSYNLQLERDLGITMNNRLNLDESENIWSDYPTVLLYANWDPTKAVSTELMLKNKSGNYRINSKDLIDADIRYIIAANSDRSRVLDYFPSLNSRISSEDTVDIGYATLILVHEEVPPAGERIIFNANIFGQLKNHIISTNRPISLWEIRPKIP